MNRFASSIWKSRCWLVLAWALAPAGLALSQGTIIYHQSTLPISPVIGRQFDLNDDGQTDLRFYDASYLPASYWATDASGVGSARLLVVPNLGVDGGSHLAALNLGFLIGDSLSPGLSWAAQNAPNNYGDAVVIGSYLPEIPQGGPVPVGFFYDTFAFMGVHFQIGSDWHYGWVRIRGGTAGVGEDGQFHLNPPAWILDWAYESRPNTPIFAGAVPEPSTLNLFLFCLLAVAFLNRKHRSAFK
jgi:hypothetical protein